jgi:signal peptidase II
MVVGTAAALLVLDAVLSGLVLAAGPRTDGVVLIPGLLAFHDTWNRGISFSLFWQSSAAGSMALALFQLVASIAVLVWATRSDRPVFSAAMAAIAAGALGNAASRILYGGVFDFLALHLGAIPLFVFNVSDALISLGVLGLIADTIRRENEYV